MAVAGSDLYVADFDGGSVTEVSLSTGALVRVIWGPDYQFAGPGAVVLSRDNLFVANAGGPVTKIGV